MLHTLTVGHWSFGAYHTPVTGTRLLNPFNYLAISYWTVCVCQQLYLMQRIKHKTEFLLIKIIKQWSKWDHPIETHWVSKGQRRKWSGRGHDRNPGRGDSKGKMDKDTNVRSKKVYVAGKHSGPCVGKQGEAGSKKQAELNHGRAMLRNLDQFLKAREKSLKTLGRAWPNQTCIFSRSLWLSL